MLPHVNPDRAPYLCQQNAASQPCFRALDSLPTVLECTAILGPPVMWPLLQQKHYIQALWKHQPPFSPGASSVPADSVVYLGSAGCRECYHSQGTRSPVLTAYSGPSRQMLQALSSKEVSLQLSYHQGFPVPREDSGFREMK